MTLFDIGTLDNKVKEVNMTNDDLYKIFDENGQHKLNKFSIKPKTKFRIDFFEEKFKVFVIIPEVIRVSANKVIGSLENARRELILSKYFKISPDFNKVTIDEIEHVIPKFFNREMMKNEDENTWEIIFRQIFQKEIFDKMQNQKELQDERVRNVK